MFVNTTVLNVTPSYVIEAERLPTANAAVVTIARTCHVPEPGRNDTLDDDTHSVDSEWLPPTRVLLEYLHVDAIEPSTVTLAVPVPCTLLRDPLLTTAPSSVTVDDIVPVCAATVIATRAAPKLNATRAATLVVDIQVVASKCEPPSRVLTE